MTTVKTLIDLVFKDYEHNGRSTQSIACYAKHIRPWFDDMGADEVRKSDLTFYIDDRKKDGASPATINRELALLRRGYKLGLEEEIVNRVPVFKLLKENNVRQGFAEHDEFEKVKSVLPGQLRRPYVFAYYIGRRRGEILQYLKTDVDTELRLLRVRGEITKNKRGGVVALTGEVWDVVKEAYDASPGPYLFGYMNGSKVPATTFYVEMKRAFAAAGVPQRRFHDLRRTASRNAIRAGNHRKLAKMITGHLSDATFDRYDIIDETDIIAAAERVSEYVRNKNGNGEKSDVDSRKDAIKDVLDSRSKSEISPIKSTEAGVVARFIRLLKGGRI